MTLDPTTLIVGAAIVCAVLFAIWPLLPKRWPRRHTSTPEPPNLGVRHANESTLARERAERQLKAIRSETPHVLALADELRAKRERNHFADSIRRSMELRGN